MILIPLSCYQLRGPAGTTAENTFIWWPPDNYLGPPDKKKIFSAAVPAVLLNQRTKAS